MAGPNKLGNLVNVVGHCQETDVIRQPSRRRRNVYPFQIDLLVTALSASLVWMKDRGVIADQISMSPAHVGW